MADTPCAHERITTASADGLPSLWYCDDCRRRFYPACSACVDVGHRNEAHVHAPTPDPSAVAAPCGDCGPYAPCPKHDGDTVDPAAVAAWLSEDDRLARALPGAINFRFLPPRLRTDPTWREVAAAIIRALTDPEAGR